MEYIKILEKVITSLEKSHFYENITVRIDNSKRINILEKKQNICPDEWGCHMSKDERWEIDSRGVSKTKLYPNDDVEESIETPFYRIDLICEGKHFDNPELFGYRAYIFVDENQEIKILKEDFNYICNCMTAKVYEKYKWPNNPDEEVKLELQVFVLDEEGLTWPEPIYNELGIPYQRKNGEVIQERTTSRSGELCAFSYDDNSAHVLYYNGNYAGKSATEDNVFYTFEEHKIYKYTIEYTVDTKVENGKPVYESHVGLKEELYYYSPVEIRDHFIVNSNHFESLKVVPGYSEYHGFTPSILKYNPMIITINGEKRLMIRIGNEEPIFSEPFDEMEFIDRPVSHMVKSTVYLGDMPIEKEVPYIDSALEFKVTKDKETSSLFLDGNSGKPKITKTMKLINVE